MAETEPFSLLLKTKVNIYIIKAYIGYILLENLSLNQALKIPFTYFEIFYQYLLSMINFFLDSEYINETRKLIFVFDNQTVSIISTMVQDEKLVKITQCDDITLNFEIILNFDHFYLFLKAFSSCMLSTLKINQDQKLLFQTLFSDDFEWPLETDLTTLNESKTIAHFLKIKISQKLNVDISDTFLIYKFYLPIFILLNKANGLMILNLDSL